MCVVLLMPPFNVLTGYFFVSLNLVADPTVLNFDTLRDTVVCYTVVFSVYFATLLPTKLLGRSVA